MIHYNSIQPMVTLRRPVILSMTVREYFPVIESVNRKLIDLGYAHVDKLSDLNESFRIQATSYMQSSPELGLLYACFGNDFDPSLVPAGFTKVPQYSFPGFDIVSLEVFLNPSYQGPDYNFRTIFNNDSRMKVFFDILNIDQMNSGFSPTELSALIRAVSPAVFSHSDSLSDSIYSLGVAFGMSVEQINNAMPLAIMTAKALGVASGMSVKE